MPPKSATPKPITHVILTHSDGDYEQPGAFPTGLTITRTKQEEQDAALAAAARRPPADHADASRHEQPDAHDRRLKVTPPLGAAHTRTLSYLPTRRLCSGDIISGALTADRTSTSEGAAAGCGGGEGHATLDADRSCPGTAICRRRQHPGAHFEGVETSRRRIAAMIRTAITRDQSGMDAPVPAGGRGPATTFLTSSTTN